MEEYVLFLKCLWDAITVVDEHGHARFRDLDDLGLPFGDFPTSQDLHAT